MSNDYLKFTDEAYPVPLQYLLGIRHRAILRALGKVTKAINRLTVTTRSNHWSTTNTGRII